ncbi:MAG: oxidoreductase, partial [Comamonadaceae bacterium]
MIAVKVLRKQQEAVGIASFELARADGGALPAFSAGSHIDVQVPGGHTRQYSLCNDAGEQHRYRIAVLRDPASRGGSVAMHDALNEGDTLLISEPRNHFPLVHAKRTLLFAGGIGVTPLLCMAQRLAAIDADFTLHYSSRSVDRTAFHDEIRNAPFAQRVQFHHDDGDAGQKLDLRAVLANPDPGTHLYVCGPTGYIDFVVKTAKEQGWATDNVHLEYFGAAPQDTTGDQPFQVKIASSGQVIEVGATETVVQALEKNGVDVMISCEQGVCGTEVLEVHVVRG